VLRYNVVKTVSGDADHWPWRPRDSSPHRGAHRVFYVATLAEAVYVLHAFEKKTRKTAAHDLELGRIRFRSLGKLKQQHGKEKRR
jgi:phage-related protein